jgi:hypothetical protein
LINAKWHKQHVMSMGSSLRQRVNWHVAHAKACGCREVPPTVLKELRRLGKKAPNRRGYPAKATAGTASAEALLCSFIEKFEPKDQRLIRAVRSAVRKRFPTANELVWDNYNFFVIGYSPTERPTDSIVSIAARANGVGLCFIHGAGLPDPKKLLLGTGKQTRFLRVESARLLTDPDVEALIAAAIERAKTPLRTSGRGRLLIRSVAAKQRPRQKSAT